LGTGIFYSQKKANDLVRTVQLHPEAIPKIVSAYKHVSTIDAFFPIGKTKDAGVVLNQFIPLDQAEVTAQEKVWWNSRSTKELQLIKKDWLNAPESYTSRTRFHLNGINCL
jgi:hypothetical protein